MERNASEYKLHVRYLVQLVASSLCAFERTDSCPILSHFPLREHALPVCTQVRVEERKNKTVAQLNVGDRGK